MPQGVGSVSSRRGSAPASRLSMTERQRAAQVLLEAEMELQRATQARLRNEKDSRARLAAAKVAMVHAHWRACRASGVRPVGHESRVADYGLRRLSLEVLQRALRRVSMP